MCNVSSNAISYSQVLQKVIELGPDPRQIQISDEELIRAIAGGDEPAFASLYRRYSSILFGYLLRILHSNAEAEDVLQEVFVHVWQHATDFDETRGRVFSWLIRIAHSRAIDRLRALRARDRTATRATLESSGVVSDEEDDAIRLEQGELVRRALDEISAEQRDALMLAYFEGLSQTEIAARIQKPLGTVKTRTRDGLKKLRELLRRKMKKQL